VFVLRCSGWFFLVLAFFGLVAATDCLVQVVGHPSESAHVIGNTVSVSALVFAALVLMPTTLWLYRTGHPRWCVLPQVRDWSTEKIQALFQ
jgi:hypothetical protein